MVLEVWVDLKQPDLLSRIVDEGVKKGNIDLIKSTGLLMIGLVFLGGLAGLSSAFFGSTASQSFGRDLRNASFRKVMSLSLEQADDFTTGSLVTRLTNDITTVQNMVNMGLRFFVRAPLTFIGGIIMALGISWKFGVVIAVALPIEGIIMFLVMRKATPLFTTVQQKLDTVNSVVEENVNGVRVVKAYVREEHEKGRFDKANAELSGVNYRVLMILAYIIPAMTIIMNATVIAVIAVGGYDIGTVGTLEVGQIMSGVTFVTMILSSLLMVGFMFQQITRAMASAKRINEVLDCIPVIRGGELRTEERGEGSVVFKDVSFHYPGTVGRPVLCDIDLDIKPGEYIAILGATGSGKTSLVNLITRFYDATSGEILVDGVNVKEYDLETLRSKIAFVLQKSELFAGTIAENIRWGAPDATDDEVRNAARIAQADEFITSFVDGYNTVVDQKGSSLSGGQKQRVSIARALVRKPEIIIFDDSTSALDIGTESRLRAALRTSLADTTVIMIAQRIASVMQADRIAVLENGVITACGTHKELMRTSAAYRDIYDSQIRDGGETDER
ncbi:MAG: ABC transporter ATP-binding protein [Clostridia bacterium]|nr:ABC transporter ATP-binding protein [Clostridia bacterium]